MKQISTSKLASGGLMAALVVVGTMLIQVPTPTKGYIHIGDSMVYLSGVLLGQLVGALSAAIGSFLADIFSAYGVYAPATLIIKGLDAWIVGYIYRQASKSGSVSSKVYAFSLAVLAGGGLMVSGYLAYETFLYGFEVAVLGIIGNVTQAIGGGVLALPVVLVLDKIGRK